jgi:alpha-L-arabinofuranosidase
LATPNYYVQQLISRNHGDRVLPIDIKNEARQSSGAAKNRAELFASATLETGTGEIILKVVNAANSATEAEIKLETTSTVSENANTILLTGTSGAVMNSFDQPRTVAPVASTIQNASNSFSHTFLANSMTVLRLKLK